MSTSLIEVFKAKEETGVLKTVGEMCKEAPDISYKSFLFK